MPENHGCPNLFLPNHWSRHVKPALLHVISLARLAYVHTWALGRNAPMPRAVEPPEKGEVVSTPYLDGLHHLYTRAT